MSTEFLDTATEILAEYGEPAKIVNRSGTTLSTAVQCYSDEGNPIPDYYAENADNAEDIRTRTIYMAGNGTVDVGYRVVLTAGTFQVVHLSSPMEGTTTAIHILGCRSY